MKKDCSSLMFPAKITSDAPCLERTSNRSPKPSVLVSTVHVSDDSLITSKTASGRRWPPTTTELASCCAYWFEDCADSLQTGCMRRALVGFCVALGFDACV